MITRRILTQADFNQFAQLSGDDNPIHVDTDFSAKTRFGRTVSHGMLLFTIVRGLFEQRLPGYQLFSQALMFPSPCYADEELECFVEIEDLTASRAKAVVRIKQISDSAVVLQGEALLEPGKAP